MLFLRVTAVVGRMVFVFAQESVWWVVGLCSGHRQLSIVQSIYRVHPYQAKRLGTADSSQFQRLGVRSSVGLSPGRLGISWISLA